jgi:DNA-binding response OmpR family regulator
VPALDHGVAHPGLDAVNPVDAQVPDGVPLASIVSALARALDASLSAVQQALPSLEPSPRAADPAVRRHTLERIAHETEETRAALAALAALCELRADGAELRPAPIELGDVLMNVIPAWKPRAPHHIFELALSGQAPAIIADEDRVERVLNVLLEHAVRMSPRGGTIRVSVRPRHEEVVVSVRQQGRSVPVEQFDRLFSPCARLEGCEDVVIDGGLGLTLACAIVEAHGGRIWAELPDGLPGLIVFAAWPLVPSRKPHPTAAAAPAADPPALAATPSDRLPLDRARQVILIAIADAHLARYLRANLEAERFRALVMPETNELYRQIDLEEPDLVLVDAELPGIAAPEDLQRLRAHARAPVIVLASRHDPVECARALNQGASDYLARPFSIEELIARMRAALRGAPATSRQSTQEPTFMSGDLSIDFTQHAVTVEGRPIALSKTEFKLLRALAQHAGMVLSHEALLERVWGPAYQREVEFIWVYIRRLRRKIEPDPAHPRYILTVPGVGYRLVRT